MMPLSEVGEKLAAGRRLGPDDADVVAGAGDLLGLGVLADERRRRRRGDRTTFVRVQKVPIERIASSDVAIAPSAGEVRITGGVDRYEQALRAVERLAPLAGSTPVTGFAIDRLAEIGAWNPEAVLDALAALREAGLSQVAEARADRLPGPEWLEAAGRAGLRIGRLTAGGPAGGDGVAPIRRLADWGAALAHVHAFAPLPASAPTPPTTGFQDLRQVAIARLLIDNIDSLQIDWSVHGPKLAQVALTFGVDDLDGVSPIDDRSLGPRRTPIEEVVRNVRAAALVPVERNGRFESLER